MKQQLNFVGDYLEDSLKRIPGYDYNWTSLITSRPLLFEDVNYLKVKQFIDDTITQEEIDAYKNGDLRDLYATFDNLLLCNMQYYDRIMSYCTMIFYHYMNIDGDVYSKDMEKVTYEFLLTPTKIWCASMACSNSTKWELEYGYSIGNLIHDSQDCLKANYDVLLKSESFKLFSSYRSFANKTTGFRNTRLADKTDNVKLSKVCQKFILSSSSVSDDQLSTLHDYSLSIDENNKRLYNALEKCLSSIYNSDSSQYAIYIFNNVFYIHTSKFSMKVSKDVDGKLSKDYLSNSYECFAAEQYLVQSIKQQIEWSKFKLENKFNYDKKILTNILLKMLNKNYRNVVAIKRMNNVDGIEEMTMSKATFTGIFSNLYIEESFVFNNRKIKSYKKCLSKENTASYLVDSGYYIFGTEEDIMKFLDKMSVDGYNKNSLIEHYTGYCTAIGDHMKEHVNKNMLLKKEIIDFVCNGIDVKVNDDIIETNIKGIKNVDRTVSGIAISMKIKQKSDSSRNYWQVIEE